MPAVQRWHRSLRGLDPPPRGMRRIKVKPGPSGSVTLYGVDAELATLSPEDVLDLIKDLAAALDGRERREVEPKPPPAR